MKNKARHSWIKALCLCLGIASFIFAWWLIAFLLRKNGSSVVMTPGETFLRIIQVTFGSTAGTTWAAIGWTLLRLMVGFGISFVLGALLGTLAGLWQPLEFFLQPWIVFHRTIPTAAVVLILSTIVISPKTLIWVDYIPCILTFFVAFPLIYQAFLAGMKNEEKDILDSLQMDAGKSSFSSIVSVRWPDMSNFVWLAVAQALGLSMKVSIMAEVMSANSASHPGIGTLIMYCTTNPENKVEDILTYSFLALAIVLILDIPLIITLSKSHKEKKKNEMETQKEEK